MEQALETLLRTMVHHATIFLADAAEFYPFGGIVNLQQSVVPLSASPGGNFPKSADVLKLLDKAIEEKFRQQEIRAAAIVADTAFRATPESPPVDAIRVTLLAPPAAPQIHYYPYRVVDDKVSILDHFVY
jgi:hypothetical protein